MSQAHSSHSSLFTRCGLAKEFPAVVEEGEAQDDPSKSRLESLQRFNSHPCVFIRSRQVRYYDGVAGVCC